VAGEGNSEVRTQDGKVLTAAHCVAPAAEHGGPMIFAQMGMMQAIHRHRKREFNPARKDTFGKSGS